MELRGDYIKLDEYMRTGDEHASGSVLSLFTRPLWWALRQVVGSSDTAEQADEAQWKRSQGAWVVKPLVEVRERVANQI